MCIWVVDVSTVPKMTQVSKSYMYLFIAIWSIIVQQVSF